MVTDDEIEQLINETHAIFSATSIYEVIDMPDNKKAEEFLNETYNRPGHETIIRYLDVLNRLQQTTM